MQANEDFSNALRRVDGLCDRGYATYDPGYYTDIVETLRPFEGRDGVDGLIRLAEGGPNLASKRFAYPHIQDRARTLRTAIQAVA